MADPRDPIAELADELAREAETQAKASTNPDDEADDEKVVTSDDEGKEEVEAKASDAEGKDDDQKAQEAIEGKKDPKEVKRDVVPRTRLDEEYAKRRKAERIAREKDEELARLKAGKDGDTKTNAETEEQLRERIRGEEVFKINVKAMLDNAKETYGDAFDEAANRLEELGAPGSIVALALESTDGPKEAAKALYLLGQQPPEEVERVLKLPTLKQATYLARLSTQRARSENKEEEEKPSPKKPARVAPRPISPVGGKDKMAEGFGDDVPDEVFNKRFNEEILGIGRSH